MRVLTSLIAVLAVAVLPVLADDTRESADAGWSVVPGEPSIDSWQAPDYTLYDNGPFITHFGTGYHGANESWLQQSLGMTILGFGHQLSANNRVADDFTVPPGQAWVIQNVMFFAYQTGAGLQSTISSVNVRIWNGQPGAGGSVIWGNTTTNRMTSTQSASTYRVTESTTGTATDRAIMANNTSIPVTLGPGTYWIDWQSDGDIAFSGPWVPPVTVLGQTSTGNAVQSQDGGASYQPLIDDGTGTPQGLPFIIDGFIQASNDTCGTAEVITCPPGGGMVSVIGDTNYATMTGSYFCAGTYSQSPEVWYRIVGNGGDITASTCSDFNPYLYTELLTFDGSCSNLGCVAAYDEDCPGIGYGGLGTVSWPSTLGTEYYVLVSAGIPGDGFTGNFELTVTCEASCTNLQTPTIESVGDVPCGGTTTRVSPALRWYDVPNESGYNWELRDSFGIVIRTGSVGADVTAADLGPLSPGTYIARVQAYGDDITFCDSQWSSSCSFEVAEPCEPLATPEVTSIGGTSCGGTTGEISPVLSWTDVANEEGYEWEVRNLSGGVMASGSTGPDVTSVNIGALAIGSFSVSVRAIGDGIFFCNSFWSTDCPFDIAEACDQLALPTISSIGGVVCGGATTETSPTLAWTDVANEDGYKWEVRDTFGALIADGSTGPNVSAVNVGTLGSGVFNARVQAVGDGIEFCDSEWTSYCSFEVVGECETLPAPTITAVADTTCGGSTKDENPVVRWTDLEGDTGYGWEVRDSLGNLVRSGTTQQDATSAAVGSLDPGDYTVRVRAFGDDVYTCDGDWSSSCPFEIIGEIGVADFIWWPIQPKVGEHVRFADRSTGVPIGWFWETGDGWTSTAENPFHRYSSSGDFGVSMECQYPGGTDTKIWEVRVSGVIRCGDELCEGEETAWSCPDDCGLPPQTSGRAGGSDRRPSVPAAVGGVGGTGGTFWKTEGWVVNTGDEPVPLIFEYTPLGSTEIFTAGPFDLEPDNGLYWDNIVEDLFGAKGNGALWLDAPKPVHFLTRSYNESSGGNFGQAVSGLRGRLSIGKGDGEVYLVGLRHDQSFRSNLFFQEIDGFWVTLEIEVYNEDGERLRRSTLDVEGHSNVLKNLGNLGGSGQDSAYVTVRVLDGDGRLNVVGSVVDQITGDPTTVDPIHLDQVVLKNADGTKLLDDAHHLVAVVAHTKGSQNSVWGTKFTVGSPKGAAGQELTFVYVPEYDRTGVVGNRLERTATLPGGRQLVWDDVLIDLFGLPQSAKTQGALHVYSPDEVLITSRTYNRKPDGSTLGQNIKALTAGDLVDTATPGLIMGLSHRPGSRTNMGVAAFSNQDTEIEIRFFSNFPAFSPLGSISRGIEAESHLQIPKVFEELGLSSVPLESVSAYVTVRSGGSVYAYASIVDNGSGDPTTLVATRIE